MMMTFKEFVEKFNEAVPDPKEVEEYAKDPEIQKYADNPNVLTKIVKEKEIKMKKAVSDAIKKALASVPPTP